MPVFPRPPPEKGTPGLGSPCPAFHGGEPCSLPKLTCTSWGQASDDPGTEKWLSRPCQGELPAHGEPLGGGWSWALRAVLQEDPAATARSLRRPVPLSGCLALPLCWPGRSRGLFALAR